MHICKVPESRSVSLFNLTEEDSGCKIKVLMLKRLNFCELKSRKCGEKKGFLKIWWPKDFVMVKKATIFSVLSGWLIVRIWCFISLAVCIITALLTWPTYVTVRGKSGSSWRGATYILLLYFTPCFLIYDAYF